MTLFEFSFSFKMFIDVVVVLISSRESPPEIPPRRSLCEGPRVNESNESPRCNPSYIIIVIIMSKTIDF